MRADAQAAAAQEASQISTLLAARAYLLEVFHKCFGGAPDAALIAALTSQDAQEAVALYAEEDEAMAGFGTLLAELARKNATETPIRARDEYTRVFEGPGALPAPPYRAPYAGSRDAALFQEATLEVRRMFHAQGLRARREQAVPDDHVALLFDFAARGACALQERFADGDETFAQAAREQHSVLSSYLADWLSEYAKLVRNSRVGQHAVLYPQLLEAAAAFVRVDCVFLGEAAWWFAQLRAESDAVAAMLCKEADAAAAKRLTDARSVLANLRLRGLEDNELTVFDRLEG